MIAEYMTKHVPADYMKAESPVKLCCYRRELNCLLVLDFMSFLVGFACCMYAA